MTEETMKSTVFSEAENLLFFEELGDELVSGRRSLVRRRQRRTLVAGVACVAALLAGGVIAAGGLTESTVDLADGSSEVTRDQTTQEGAMQEGVVPSRDAVVDPQYSDTSEVEQDGPQRLEAGEGWRLLHTGPPVRNSTWSAFTPTQYEELATALIDVREWPDVEWPEVDFDSEIVIWFGLMLNDNCPGEAIVEMVFDSEASKVYPIEGGRFCSEGSYGSVVVVERSALPDAPFIVQTGPESDRCCDESNQLEVTAEMLAGTEVPPPLAKRLSSDPWSPEHEVRRGSPEEIAEAVAALEKATISLSKTSGDLDLMLNANKSQFASTAEAIALLEHDSTAYTEPLIRSLDGLFLLGTSGTGERLAMTATPTWVSVSGQRMSAILFDPTGSVLLALGESIPMVLSDSERAAQVEIMLFSAEAGIAGMAEHDAIEAIEAGGYEARVIERDLVPVDVQGVRPDRVNLYITDGVVTALSFD